MCRLGYQKNETHNSNRFPSRGRLTNGLPSKIIDANPGLWNSSLWIHRQLASSTSLWSLKLHPLLLHSFTAIVGFPSTFVPGCCAQHGQMEAMKIKISMVGSYGYEKPGEHVFEPELQKSTCQIQCPGSLCHRPMTTSLPAEVRTHVWQRSEPHGPMGLYTARSTVTNKKHGKLVILGFTTLPLCFESWDLRSTRLFRSIRHSQHMFHNTKKKFEE